MAPISRQYTELDDFPGLVTNFDGGSIPPGAASVQTNLLPNRVGELCSRPGLGVVTFEEDT